MITRKVLRCSQARSVRIHTRAKNLSAKARKYSTSTSSTSTPSHTSNATSVSSLSAFTNELDRIAPKFEIHGSQIQVLHSPAEFYETLKVPGYAREVAKRYADGVIIGKDIGCRRANISFYFVYRQNGRWTCKSHSHSILCATSKRLVLTRRIVDYHTPTGS